MDNPYLIDLPLFENWDLKEVILHPDNEEMVTLCHTLLNECHYDRYKSAKLDLCRNGSNNVFISIKCRKHLFWSNWVDVVECSQWFSWTTPSLRKTVTSHLNEQILYERKKREDRRKRLVCEWEKDRVRLLKQREHDRSNAINQWK